MLSQGILRDKYSTSIDLSPHTHTNIEEASQDDGNGETEDEDEEEEDDDDSATGAASLVSAPDCIVLLYYIAVFPMPRYATHTCLLHF